MKHDPDIFSFSMKNICLIEIHKNILFVFQLLKESDHELNGNKLYSKVIFNQVRIYNLNKSIIGFFLSINMICSKYWLNECSIILQNILFFIQKINSLENHQ